MDFRLTIILFIATSLALFILSIALRRKRRLRLLLRSLGIMIGLIPLLLYCSYLLIGYIKERAYVGTYEYSDTVVGTVGMQLFDNNTFEMKSDSCSLGFVQGHWRHTWGEDRVDIELISTSQSVGEGSFDEGGSLYLSNVPVCLTLVRKLVFRKKSETTDIPREEFGY